MKQFYVWYKKENDRKWHKSSLMMRDEKACKKQADALKKQENWKEVLVVEGDNDPNYSKVESSKKEIWQMTKEEYEKLYGKPKKNTSLTGGFHPHKEAIMTALNMGKPVPQSVLKDYPELAKNVNAMLKGPTKEEVVEGILHICSKYPKMKKFVFEDLNRSDSIFWKEISKIQKQDWLAADRYKNYTYSMMYDLAVALQAINVYSKKSNVRDIMVGVDRALRFINKNPSIHYATKPIAASTDNTLYPRQKIKEINKEIQEKETLLKKLPNNKGKLQSDLKHEIELLKEELAMFEKQKTNASVDLSKLKLGESTIVTSSTLRDYVVLDLNEQPPEMLINFPNKKTWTITYTEINGEPHLHVEELKKDLSYKDFISKLRPLVANSVVNYIMTQVRSLQEASE